VILIRLDRALELLGIRKLVAQITDMTQAVARIERVLSNEGAFIVATMSEVNAKLDELIKDTRRVIKLVKNAPSAAATQAEVDALADKLDALDTEAEEASPEEAAPVDGSTPVDTAPADGSVDPNTGLPVDQPQTMSARRSRNS
jgi:ribosomal protein L12E/L44/L45/RPP1/RPP2